MSTNFSSVTEPPEFLRMIKVYIHHHHHHTHTLIERETWATRFARMCQHYKLSKIRFISFNSICCVYARSATVSLVDDKKKLWREEYTHIHTHSTHSVTYHKFISLSCALIKTFYLHILTHNCVFFLSFLFWRRRRREREEHWVKSSL
jgi:hypothetical protein